MKLSKKEERKQAREKIRSLSGWSLRPDEPHLDASGSRVRIKSGRYLTYRNFFGHEANGLCHWPKKTPCLRQAGHGYNMANPPDHYFVDGDEFFCSEHCPVCHG